MANNAEILKILENQEKRIKKLEKQISQGVIIEEEVPEKVVKKKQDKREPSKLSQLTFTQVITFLGVIGIIIGVISFFFYAVANDWIGETAQIMIGVLIGFILFVFASIFRSKSESWSNIIFGGSFFIEYLAVGVGVLGYKIMPDFVGVGLAIIFLIASTALSIKFRSRFIAYFTLVGGYIVPFITGYMENDMFIMLFFTVISIGLVILSFAEDWSDLRFSSFVVLSIFLLIFQDRLINSVDKALSVVFLIIFFVLYHASSIISSIKNKKETISVLDSIIIIGFTVVFLFLIYRMFEWSVMTYGVFVMLFSFIYLIEIMLFKAIDVKISDSVLYTLISAGVITLDLGIFLILDIASFDYILVVFIIEYILFSVISKKVPNENFYKAAAFVSLVLILISFMSIRFNDGVLHATSFMLFYLVLVIAFALLFKENINFKLNAAAFIIGGFLFIYKIFSYLEVFDIPSKANHIILSILWLIYTLTLFTMVRTKEGKLLVGALLGITLLKIAFKDLFFLDGVFRIIGFIIFGILLIIGGYLISRYENKD